MVTRSVILVTPSEAAAFAATTSSSPAAAAAAAAAADSIISNAPFEQNRTEELHTNLFNYPSYSKPAQHPSPVGLVQLQNQKGPMDGEQNDSEDDAKIRAVTGDEYCLDDGFSDRHSTHGNNYGLDEVGKKRGRPSEDSISGKDDIKRQRVDAFIIDLTDVPPHPPIPKSAGRIKEGASQYTGVSFDKRRNKWKAQIMIDGRLRHIGSYENEEEAAVDYARAVFKYKGQGALDNAREQDSFIIDLSDVSPQPPIPKIEGAVIDGASTSKYTGVSFCKPMKKWHAQIMIDGKNRTIGYYENEEEAGADYARTLFKYKGQGALDNAREQDSFTFDLTDVPPQPPIPKSAGHIKEGASQYTGVSFDKRRNKWKAQISIDGKQRSIGYYENEEEAAADYTRAFVKYKGRWALDKAREQDSFSIDLSDVPPQPQPPIPKSDVG